MIKIISSHNIPNDENISAVALCNSLNQDGIDCVFYGLSSWHLDKCKTLPLSKFKVRKNDLIITTGFALDNHGDLFCLNTKLRGLHHLKSKRIGRVIKSQLKKFYNSLRGIFYRKFASVKLIFSTNEDRDFDFVKIAKFYDKIHLTDSNIISNKNIKHFVCPNVKNENLITITKTHNKKVAGIVGTICSYRGILESINKSLEDGFEKIVIYGFMQDPVYFYDKIEPLMKENKGKIQFAGFVESYLEIFSEISDIYFYPNSKIATTLPQYCASSLVDFHGNDNVILVQNIENDEAVKIWLKELGVSGEK
ncbi:MAG: hypothetical protein ACI9TO_001351 [Rickettsiales bacterium]|jgi:hypothetical protein